MNNQSYRKIATPPTLSNSNGEYDAWESWR